MDSSKEFFTQNLLVWYASNQRKLPWTTDRNPYYVWISEIILQQTRVDQGLDFFNRFIDRFPSVTAIAQASEDEVLKAWEGLGYYSRARNIYKSALLIDSLYKSEIPETIDQLLELPGIGPYTARAIMSFAYNKPYACVDGNVIRILSRFTGEDIQPRSSKGMKIFQNLADQYLAPSRSRDYNQAMMDFGSLQCIPKNPNCDNCPMHNHCYAFLHNQVSLLPSKRRPKKKKNRNFDYYMIGVPGSILVRKRPLDDIWAGLYEFCLIEHEHKSDMHDIILNLMNKYSPILCLDQIRHVLSHQNINMRLSVIQLKSKNEASDLLHSYQWVDYDSLINFAFPAPLKKIMSKHNIMSNYLNSNL